MKVDTDREDFFTTRIRCAISQIVVYKRGLRSVDLTIAYSASCLLAVKICIPK